LKDKATIIQGRAIVDAYVAAHQALHSKPWIPGVPEQHTPLLNEMLSQLNQLGFNSAEEISEEEYIEHLLGMSVESSSPLRFLDVSSLSLQSFVALNEVVLHLRAQDKIPDTLLYRYLEGGKTVAVGGGNSPKATAFAEKCKQLGIEYVRTQYGTRGVLYHDDVLGRLVTKNNRSDAWKAMLNAVVKTLWFLGVEAFAQPGSNNIKVSGKKIAQGIKSTYKDVNFVLTAIFRDFDYDIGAEAFDQPDIRDRIITIKEALGRDIPRAEFKTAYIQSCRQALSNSTSEESLSAEEQSLLSYLQPKYESEEWNALGLSNIILVGTEEIINVSHT